MCPQLDVPCGRKRFVLSLCQFNFNDYLLNPSFSVATMRYYLLTSFDHLTSTEKPGMLKLKVRCIISFSRGPGSAVGKKQCETAKKIGGRIQPSQAVYWGGLPRLPFFPAFNLSIFFRLFPPPRSLVPGYINFCLATEILTIKQYVRDLQIHG